MIFKIAFGKQIHLVNSQDKQKLSQLLNVIPSLFKGLPNRFTLTYVDEEGDEITLKQQEDYGVLKESGLKTVKIIIKENWENFNEMTSEIVIEESIEAQEEEKVQQIILNEPKEPSNDEKNQGIDDSLIEEKLKMMMPQIISKIKSEITEEIIEKSRTLAKDQPIIVEEPVFKKESKVEKVIHKGITCDGCNFKDIEGIRYKCSVCSNFDFCEKCEATVDHPHPFLKIKTLKQTPIKIIAVINEDDGPSLEVNGQHFGHHSFDNLIHHGLDLFRGFLGGENHEAMRNRCHAAKEEWKKRSQDWKKAWNCPQKEEHKVETEEKPEKKIEEKVQVKPEEKKEEKIEEKKEEKKEESGPRSVGYEEIKANANYLVEVFGYSFEKCLKWAQMYPYMSKEELLSYCLSQPSFYN